MDKARRTTRLAKVLTFFGVMLLTIGTITPMADAARPDGLSKGQLKKMAEKVIIVDDSNLVDGVTSGGANGPGDYDDGIPGDPSHNGNSDNGNRPCAGCVGNADDKNPPGQFKDGSDGNNGYECDGNNGIAKTNPAHTGCPAVTTTTTVPSTTTTAPSTTTTAPSTTTTTLPSTTTTSTPDESTTTTSTPDDSTTTTAPTEVLGVQFEQPGTLGGALASTGAFLLRPMVAAGLLLMVLGALLMVLRRREAGDVAGQ